MLVQKNVVKKASDQVLARIYCHDQIPRRWKRPAGAGRLGLSHWAGPSVTGVSGVTGCRAAPKIPATKVKMRPNQKGTSNVRS